MQYTSTSMYASVIYAAYICLVNHTHNYSSISFLVPTSNVNKQSSLLIIFLLHSRLLLVLHLSAPHFSDSFHLLRRVPPRPLPTTRITVCLFQGLLLPECWVKSARVHTLRITSDSVVVSFSIFRYTFSFLLPHFLYLLLQHTNTLLRS